jgi:MoaA/NifB/PqqE/SkfB family radical SAM enzyme
MVVPLAVELEMRGGSHPDPEMDAIEHNIAELAFQKCITEPKWAEIGFKRTYNAHHLFTFYMTRNPQIIKLLYRLKPYPWYIEMEVTQRCHLKCIMCEHTYWNEPNTTLSLEDFKKTMDQFPELKWAGNNALGDPFLNKDYWEMVRIVGERGVNQEIYTTSSLLSEEDMERFVTMNTHLYVKFSLDGATKETYENIRKGVDFDKVVRNIKALDNYKKKHGKYWPEIHFHFIIMKQNVHEAVQYLDFLKSLNIDIGGIYYSRMLHKFPEAEGIYMDVPLDLVEKIKKHAEELHLPVSFSQDMPHLWPPASECVAWTMPYIFPDGTVIPCCCMNEQNRRCWQRANRMGNVFEKPFREIWYDKPYSQMRERLWKGNVKEAHPCCAICNIYNIDGKSTIDRGESDEQKKN